MCRCETRRFISNRYRRKECTAEPHLVRDHAARFVTYVISPEPDICTKNFINVRLSETRSAAGELPTFQFSALRYSLDL